jgi:hypothetical protein
LTRLAAVVARKEGKMANGIIKDGMIIDSVWDLPQDADPETVKGIIDSLWETEDDDCKATAFDMACGLYWHCADYHGGQASERYSILSTLEYNPGASESGPDGEAAQYVYDLLEANG